ncbi:MAG: hypothetical protein K0R82_101 [Flavipsychrobacter sp.]|jgi:hypothetical protein|nr:hypothetical protein [Flavipsychrobacter sp.]
MKNLFFIAIGTLVMFASCKKEDNCVKPDANATSIENTAKKSAVPFTGSMTYSFVGENVPCDCGEFQAVGNLHGTGNLTHLGNATSKIKPCATYLMQNGNPIGQTIGVECGSFVAANGDEVYCHTAPYNLYFTATAAVGTINCDFVGGTGKFANATGSFTGTVTVPYGQGIATFTNINGTINY